MDINRLHDDWIAAGQKAQDLLDKKVALTEKYHSDYQNMNAEDKADFRKQMENVAEEYKDAIAARDFAKETYGEAQRAARPTDKKPVKTATTKEEKLKEETNRFVSNFKNMVTSGRIPDGADTTTEDKDGSNAGLTIPEDVQTRINKFKRDFSSLESLVAVENVSNANGSRVYEKLSDIKPLANLDDDSAKIGDNDDPSLVQIKYEIHRYAGISTATNTLLADSSENILSWLIDWVAKKDVITRNAAILEVMGKAKKQLTITNFDDIKDLENKELDPLIISTSSYVTNQSGFNVLSKMKDADGRYLVQPDVTNPENKQIGGHAVSVIADRFLPDVNGSHPLYFGDFKEGIRLYNRQQMSIMSTNVGAGSFETDTTKIRFIDRFDVELIDDGAFVAGFFKDISNQTPGTANTDNTTTKSTKSSAKSADDEKAGK